MTIPSSPALRTLLGTVITATWMVAAAGQPPADDAASLAYGSMDPAPALGSQATPREARPQGWVGIQLGDAISSPGETSDPGVLITGVVSGSPAQKSGLRARDRILAIGGKPVTRSEEVIATIGVLDPESWVDLSIARKTHEMDIRVFLASRPQSASTLRMLEGWIGLEAIDLPPGLREHFGAPREAGVMISEVSPEGPAYAAGLDVGDVVFEVEGEGIGSMRTLKQAIVRGGVGNKLEIRLMRDGSEIVIEPVVETLQTED